MSLYALIKIVHILSATVLFGTGLGTAFQMWLADRTGDARVIAVISGNVALADLFFTTPAIIVQPITGAMLIYLTGANPCASWLVTAYALYLLTGACWLPVVWIQIQMRNLARASVSNGTPLPVEYRRLARLWFWLGWPAFTSVVVIFWLMVTQPALW